MHLHECSHDIVKLFVKRWSFPVSFWALVWIRESQFLAYTTQFIIIVMIKWRFIQVRHRLFCKEKICSRPSSEISSRDHRVPIEMFLYNRNPVLRFIHASVLDVLTLTPSQAIVDLEIRGYKKSLSLFYAARYDAHSSMSRSILQQCLG